MPEVREGPEPAVDDAIRRMATVLFSTETLGSVLGLVASLSVASVGTADRASITLVERNRLRTGASTDQEALALDEAQYALGEGPCIDAARHEKVAHFDAGGGRERWPRFEPVATQHGVGSILSLPLKVADRPLGALNLYALAPGRFEEGGFRSAADFAERAAVVVANATGYFWASDRAEQLLEALETRDTIGQAKGIIMTTQRCTPDEAFDILRRASQRENRKLRDLAHDIVERTQRRGEGAPHPQHPHA